MGIHTLNLMCGNKTKENILKLGGEKLIRFLINSSIMIVLLIKELLCPLRHLVFIQDRFIEFKLIRNLMLLHEKFLQFDWLRAVAFPLNLKYLDLKITDCLWVVV